MPDNIPTALKGALVEIDRASVCKVISSRRGESGWWVETMFNVALPQRDKKDGQTKLGVRREEPVTFFFVDDFPLSAPYVYLRPDFPGDLPHLYSESGPNGIRIPCIYEGQVSDLMHSTGTLHPVLMQIKDWLDRAARDGLYDEAMGWEPVILPAQNGTLFIETSTLINHVGATDGNQVIPIEFTQDERPAFSRPEHDDKNGVPKYTSLIGNGSKRETALLQIWPNEKHITVRRHLSDIETLEELFDRIGARGMGIRFPTIKRLKAIASAINAAANGQLRAAPVVLVLTLRRPVHITDQTHSLEPTPFMLDLPVRRPQELDPKDVRIKLLNHRHPASGELLARLSGIPFKSAQDPTVFIGAGSLGSKIATHLIKAGVGPIRFIDNAYLVPHVLARHEASFPVAATKARTMAVNALSHGVDAFPHVVDVLDVLKGKPEKRWTDLGIHRARFIIDTTASNHVQEALISAGASLPGRLVTAVFYANGNAAGLFLEGRNRSPRIDDLQASLYDAAINGSLQQFMHSRSGQLTRQYVGIGCHSMTMIMSNAQAALFAAGMGKQVLAYHSENPPDGGEWWFGNSDDSGLGAVWKRHIFGPTQVLNHAQDQKGWEVRVLSNVVQTMRAEAGRYAPLENGGTVYGVVNPLMRRITVTRAEEAPPDSVREHNRFLHGTQGLRDRVRAIENASNGAIAFLGTWHSHPRGGGPSPLDRDTARIFAQLRKTGPFLMLIALPSGATRALVEEDLGGNEQ